DEARALLDWGRVVPQRVPDAGSGRPPRGDGRSIRHALVPAVGLGLHAHLADALVELGGRRVLRLDGALGGLILDHLRELRRGRTTPRTGTRGCAHAPCTRRGHRTGIRRPPRSHTPSTASPDRPPSSRAPGYLLIDRLRT